MMTHITMFLTMALIQGAPQADLQRTLEKVHATYLAAGDVEANFSQTHVEKLRKKKRTEQGKLWAKADGRIRWSYLAPTRKDFIFTGKKAYFYEPEDAQVTVFDDFNDSELSAALRFLMGKGKLWERFTVAPCKQHCKLGTASSTTVSLIPKTPMSNVNEVVLYVDAKTSKVEMSVVLDSLGNRTEYRFTDVKFGGKIAEKKFDFKIPAGVQALHVKNEKK